MEHLEDFLRSASKGKGGCFKTFKKLWDQHGLSMSILQPYSFGGKQPNELVVKQHTLALFRCVTDVWQESRDFETASFALYSLWTLYHAQPLTPKLPIPLPEVCWARLVILAKDSNHKSIPEVLQIIANMRQNHVFEFTLDHSPMMGDADEQDASEDDEEEDEKGKGKGKKKTTTTPTTASTKKKKKTIDTSKAGGKRKRKQSAGDDEDKDEDDEEKDDEEERPEQKRRKTASGRKKTDGGKRKGKSKRKDGRSMVNVSDDEDEDEDGSGSGSDMDDDEGGTGSRKAGKSGMLAEQRAQAKSRMIAKLAERRVGEHDDKLDFSSLLSKHNEYRRLISEYQTHLQPRSRQTSSQPSSSFRQGYDQDEYVEVDARGNPIRISLPFSESAIRQQLQQLEELRLRDPFRKPAIYQEAMMTEAASTAATGAAAAARGGAIAGAVAVGAPHGLRLGQFPSSSSSSSTSLSSSSSSSSSSSTGLTKLQQALRDYRQVLQDGQRVPQPQPPHPLPLPLPAHLLRPSGL